MVPSTVCLHACMCASWFLGYTHCVATCVLDDGLLDVGDFFVPNYLFMLQRVSPHVRKMGAKSIKGVYFGERDVRESPLDS